MTVKTVAAAVLVVLSLPAAADPNPKLAVLQVKSEPALAGVASATGAVLANEIQRLELFEITTVQQVQAMLSIERQKQLIGFEDDAAAVTAIGEALNADLLLSSELSRLRGSGGQPVLSLDLLLLDARGGKRLSSEVLTAKSEAELVQALGPATLRLFSKVLRAKSGTLYVDSGEVGASVLVDGALLGTTPLDAPLVLAGGPHLLRVEKDGFVAFQKEVRVRPGEHTDERATLVPSPDFINAHRATAQRMRLGAYIGTSVAVAGLAAVGYFQHRTMRLYGDADSPGTFAYHQGLVNQGIESDDNGNHRQNAQQLRAQIESSQRFLAISAAGAVAGALAGVYFFIAGDSPDKYKRYEVKVTGVAIVPTGDGAASVLEARF